MKRINNTLFLLSALCICFPIGLIFLFLSEKKYWQKIVLSVLGGIIFILLLLPAVLQRNKTVDLNEFGPIITRHELSIGQTGGIGLANDTVYYTDFTVTADNQCLKIDDNTYTAVEAGLCTLTIKFEDQIRTVLITVTDANNTNDTVYASPTGERYHATLNHAGKAGIAMTEEEALQSGKTPCKICWK